MSIDLESLGFTKEELQERVINQLCKQVMTGTACDEDGNEHFEDSAFAKKLTKNVKEHIDATVAKMAEKHILPRVAEYIENLTLQKTNSWGEKTGEKLTFIEYLTKQAEVYMNEEVNYDGKNKKQCDSYSWKSTQTRLAHLVHQHLHYSIETAMKNALQIANSAITTGIQETVKLKLKEISEGLKVSLQLPR